MTNPAAGKQLSFLLKIGIHLAILCFFNTSNSYAQDELNVVQGESSNNHWIHFNDASNALYNHLSGEAYYLLNQRSQKVNRLKSRDDWQQRQDQIRENLQKIFGPFPEKTPLNAEVQRIIEKDGYKIEHIIFESQPGFYVTSSLYLPNDLDEKSPAILYLSGHTQEGYRSDTYQHKIINLAKKGFIVFAIDPVGQGERLEYFDPDTGHSRVGSATREHSYAGVQAFLTGSSLANIMTWDGIRAVDYLLTREEVDPDRLGITGRSGGGTQTAYIAAMDDRIYASAPEAYITNFTRLLQTIGPQDAEQNLYHGILNNIDHADFLAVRAPKPNKIIATTEDFFSIQGARESYEELTGLYSAYGAEDSFGMAEDGGGHQSTRDNREAMYAFFQNHLDNPGDPADLEVAVPSDEELQVTSTGQISTSLETETVFSLSRAIAEHSLETLNRSRMDPESHFERVLDAARQLSGLQIPEEVVSPVFTGRIVRDDYLIEKYFTEGEGDYVIPYLLFIPQEPTGKSLLYLHPEGKAVEAAPDGELERLVKEGYTVLAPDLLGTGEMGPGDFANYPVEIQDFAPVSFDVWPASVLIGRSILGIQAGDVLRLVRLLEKQSESQNVFAIARRDMSPTLLHAAAFDPTISRVALIEPYSSYRSIATNRFYDPGFHKSSVAGSVGKYDLPDLAASLAPRDLFIAGVTDATGRRGNSPEVQEDLNVIRAGFEWKSAEQNLKIISGDGTEDLFDLLIEWLR